MVLLNLANDRFRATRAKITIAHKKALPYVRLYQSDHELRVDERDLNDTGMWARTTVDVDVAEIAR